MIRKSLLKICRQKQLTRFRYLTKNLTWLYLPEWMMAINARRSNLKLKKNRKQGYFGKMLGGYGSDNRHRGQINVNSFSEDTQLSAIGISNNINERGFSTMRSLQNQALGTGIQNGIVDTHAGGINLNHQFSSEKDWQSSYFYTNVNQSLVRDVFQQNTSENNIYTLNKQSMETTKNRAHDLNFRYEHEFDSANILLWKGHGRISDERNASLSDINVLGDSAENQKSNNKYNTDFNNLNFDSDVLFKHRFGKKGRFMVANFDMHRRENDVLSILGSETDMLQNAEIQPMANSAACPVSRSPGKTGKRSSPPFPYAEPVGRNNYIEIRYERGTKRRMINFFFGGKVPGR